MSSYFNYHGKLRQLLRTEQYYVLPESGTFAYRFYFPMLGRSMPIRSYRVEQYIEYLGGM